MSEREDTITSLLDEKRLFPPSQEFRNQANVKTAEEYDSLVKESEQDLEGFWARQAEEHLDWYKKWDKVLSGEPPFWRWFVGGQINASYNCLDRHLTTHRRTKTALIWEGEPQGDSKSYTYEELHQQVCKFANVLKSLGVTKGDRVCMYLPMIPELPIAMLACARIGAIHSIVFGGFSAESLKDRILDAEAKILITSDGSFRRGKITPLKASADSILDDCPSVENVIVVNRTGADIEWTQNRDHWWHELIADASPQCDPEPMNADDILYILYTSGTTGKPKGVVHNTAGYLLYTSLTMKWVFDIKDDDIYWCTADIGWVTGHSYIVYGPLAVGATSLMFEGVPNYPQPDRFWKIVEKYKVSIFYTAPTAIRAIARDGDDWPNNRDLSSLRLLGSVGEPINPAAWMWYYTVIGNSNCPIVDTYWQTETGGVIITPLPGIIDLKPGSATKPFPGIFPEVVRDDGTPCNPNEGGYLIVNKPWPCMLMTVYKEPDRFVNTYFSRYPNLGTVYLTGDGARKDEDGYFWLMGRVDDVINVSGHRIGTMEVESALVSHPFVTEAAVVPFPHEIKGQALYAFVTLRGDQQPSEELRKELAKHVGKEIGPIARPDKIQFADALPKTRSGKIMRRILKAIAEGREQLGDTTTLADPSVVEELVRDRQ